MTTSFFKQFFFIVRILLLIIFGLMLSSCDDRKASYNGYIDADLVYISSDFSGKIEKIFAQKGQYVEPHQMLFSLEKESALYALGASQSNTHDLSAEKEALVSQLQYTKRNYHRLLKLYQQNSASADEVELAQENLSILENKLIAMSARIETSRFQHNEKKWQLSTRKVYAPHAGIIFDRYYNAGEFIQGGQSVFSLITPDNIKVIFFLPESDLSKISLNQKVRLFFDGTKQTQTATIQFISSESEYMSPMLFSAEERAELVYRVEAKFKKVDLRKVHLGQPVSIELVV